MSFRYTRDGDLVLKHINLDVAPGSRVAFVGHTGAGKTTMVKLIMRFYDCTAGRVTIDDQDVKHISQTACAGRLASSRKTRTCSPAA